MTYALKDGSMYTSICTYPIVSDLFALTVHPKLPYIALGLASGHVHLARVPTGPGTISTLWQTRRHKGSCRGLTFSANGAEILFSAGTDGIVKGADIKTGKVLLKFAVPTRGRQGEIDAPTLLSSLPDDVLLVATDSGALHVYDIPKHGLRTSSTNLKPTQTILACHDDYLTSLTPLHSSARPGPTTQWLSTGGTTVCVSSLKKGIIIQGEPQDEELLSSALVTPPLNDTQSKKATIPPSHVIVGGDQGTLRVWEVGVWDDSETIFRIGNEVCASVIATSSNHALPIAVGCDDGMIRLFDLKGGKQPRFLGSCKHDQIEGVERLVWCGDRLVSGGGQVVKVWEKDLNALQEADGKSSKRKMDDISSDEDDDDDCDVQEGDPEEEPNGVDHDDDRDDSDEDDDDSAEEESKQKRKKKKKRKRGGADTGAGRRDKGNGIMGFKGLD